MLANQSILSRMACMQRVGNLSTSVCKQNFGVLSRLCSTLSNSKIRERRNEIFEAEKRSQNTLIARIKKIEVKYEGTLGNCTMMMNKNLSTPHHCAMHINELLVKQSVLAEVNGTLWDMHKPLVEDCHLKFLHCKMDDPYLVNKAFWKSCSFALGVILEKAFRDNFFVQLHSWPKTNIRSGSFICDAAINIGNWVPRKDEFRTLSAMLWQLTNDSLPFERLEISQKVAENMFQDNRFKLQQIPSIVSQSADKKVIVYRVGDHIDISTGPLVGNTSHIGKSQVTAVHQIDTPFGRLHRFQGVALPSSLMLNHYAFSLIAERAAKLNMTGILGTPVEPQAVQNQQ